MPAPATPLHAADIAPQLRRIHARVLVRGWLSANNIVFHDPAEDDGPGGAPDRGACVVDTGFHSHVPQTLALIDQALAGRPLARVVNTHLHSDHCGGNAALAQRWPGLSISVPAGYRAALQGWDETALHYRTLDHHCEPFGADRFLAPGDAVRLGGRDWQVLPAPGHDPEAVLLWEPDSATLISGDALWEQRLAIIFPELTGEPGFDAASGLLDEIERLRPRLVLPGHGQPFTDVAAAIAASRQRLAAFAAAPHKHRQHAARVLVSYHLLEHRQRPRQALIDWIAGTPIFWQALQCEGDTAQAQALAAVTLDRLLADGVLRDVGGMIESAPA